MNGVLLDHPLLVVVGSGGVGKTTLAAALGVHAARQGHDTLVMTFDPSLRLKDALGVGDAARDNEVTLPLDAPGRLDVSLLDARATFDRLVRRYAPDDDAVERIYTNRYYHHLAGHLAGVLEYMAVERLFEVANAGRYDRVILDTPPTRQALDFLEAPDRIVGFLDSGALRLALKPWFTGGARPRLRAMRQRITRMLDRVVGLELLFDMAEFFQAFGPLYDGFRERATGVRDLLRRPDTRFLLVAGPGPERIPDALFFARRLKESGHHLAAIAVNQTHPPVPSAASTDPALRHGLELFAWLARRDAAGLAQLHSLVTDATPIGSIPLLPVPPTRLDRLGRLGAEVVRAVGAGGPAPP